MIERHITFNVHPDRTVAFELFIVEEYGAAMAKSPGFVKLDLLREADSPTRYQLVFRFLDADAAARWRTSDVHQGLQPSLKALVEDMLIQGYEVVA